jgi:hypothetical protein
VTWWKTSGKSVGCRWKSGGNSAEIVSKFFLKIMGCTSRKCDKNTVVTWWKTSGKSVGCRWKSGGSSAGIVSKFFSKVTGCTSRKCINTIIWCETGSVGMYRDVKVCECK